MSVSQKLYEAYKNVQPLAINSIQVDTLSTAYEIQDEVIQLKENNDDENLKGYKISLTSKETQELFDSTHPLYGGMTDQQIVQNVTLKDFNAPLLELELIFIVQDTLTVDDSEEDIMKKCTVAPGIEVPDGRYTNWFPNIDMYQVIADTAVAGAVVIGDDKEYSHEDIDDIEGTIKYNGEVVKTGRSTEVLNHPAQAVKWLIEQLDMRDKKLTPGMFVSSGTFITPIELQVGQYEAEYDVVGSVQLNVTE